MSVNITRTMNMYEAVAYDIMEDEDGMVSIGVVAQWNVEGTSITKASARAAYQEQTGDKLKKGITIKWRLIGSKTYALPVEKFMEIATVIEEKTAQEIEQENVKA